MKSKNKSPLALLGGKPVLGKPLPPPYLIGKQELAAATAVIKKGPLSDFVGAPGPYFLGGKKVRSFEAAVTKKFKVKHAVSFNSATTALHGAIVALGIGPGDEVITSPYTMSATPMAVLMNGAVPIFADIDPETFCLDPKSVEKKITKHTKAIMAVNIFGLPADLSELVALAKKHNLKIIEDNAQSPGAKSNKAFAGTVGDIGIFSFNVHKMVQSGEGGVLVTNNDQYALRAQLCRNHGESVVVGMPDYNGGPIIGSNYRMTELIAAIAEVQLSKLDLFAKKRLALVQYLAKKISGIPGITVPAIPKNVTHAYYVFPIKIDEAKLGLSRDKLVEAMTAEGFPMSKGYLKPLYMLPVFQTQKVFNNTHFPFVSEYYNGKPDYSKGSCPVTERMYEKELTLTTICQHPYTTKEIDMFVKALKKVLDHKSDLSPTNE